MSELELVDTWMGPFWVRRGNGRSDEYTLEERSYRRMRIEHGAVVLDLGAHIGTFAREALQRGASGVACVEAEERNVEVLKRNLEGSRHRVHHAAVTSQPVDEVTFYVNDGKCSTVHSTRRVRGRREVVVPTVQLGALLERYRPTTIKCDIEGGEYDCEWRGLPSYVTSVGMELHTRLPGAGSMMEEARRVMATMHEQGFTLVREVHLKEGARLPVPLWVR